MSTDRNAHRGRPSYPNCHYEAKANSYRRVRPNPDTTYTYPAYCDTAYCDTTHGSPTYARPASGPNTATHAASPVSGRPACVLKGECG